MARSSSQNSIGLAPRSVSPQQISKVSCFPWNVRKQEFEFARTFGFDALEWVFEDEYSEENPLRCHEGRSQIRHLIAQSNVPVLSVRADYFKIHRFSLIPPEDQTARVEILLELIGEARAIGAATVVFPLVQSSGRHPLSPFTLLLESLHAPLALARSVDVKIALETDLPTQESLELVTRIDHESVGLYYNVDNAVKADGDIVADIHCLGKHLCGVRLNDCLPVGRHMMEGQISPDFPKMFESLRDIDYHGPILLQSAIDSHARQNANAQLDFVRRGLTGCTNR